MTTNFNRKKTRIPVLPSVSMVKAKLEEINLVLAYSSVSSGSVSMVKAKLEEINRDVAKLEVLLRVAIEMEAIDDKKEGK